TLTGAVAISTGSGAGTIAFNNTLDGGHNLTLTAGTGNIDFAAPTGQFSPVAQLRITSVANATFNAAVSAGNFLQDAGTGTTTLLGILSTSQSPGVSITGNKLSLTAGITTSGGGPVTVVLSGTAPNGTAIIDNGAGISSDGAVSLTAPGGLTTGGDITTTNDDITITAAVTLSGSISINSGSTTGDITFSSTIDGTTGNSQSLTLNSGAAGTINVPGAIGKSTSLRILTIADSNGATLGTQDSDLIVTGTQIRVINSQPGTLVRFNAGVLTPQFNADAGPYDLQFAGSGTNIGTDNALDYQTAVLLNTGMVLFGDGNNDILMFRNGLDVDAASSIELLGWIYTQRSPVMLGDNDTATNLHACESVIDTTAAGAWPDGDNITFFGVIEGRTGGGSENLAMDAGLTGDITLLSDAGNARRIGTLKIRNAVHVTLRDVTAQTLQQTNGRGTTTFNGTVNTTSATGVDITTTNIVVNALITTIVDAFVPASAPGIVRLQATAGTASDTTGIITILDPGRIVSSNDVTIAGNRNVVPAILVYEATPAGADLTPQTRDFITTTTANADVLIESSINFISPGETANNNFIINTKAANGNITLQGAIDGNWNNFVLISGTGTVATTAAAIITEVATLTLQDNSGFSNGTINLNASIAVDWIEVFPQNYAVNILGSSNTVGV
ncbi:MAG: beta strand repeat-containing protein, partial [Planctomyces sp.]